MAAAPREVALSAVVVVKQAAVEASQQEVEVLPQEAAVPVVVPAEVAEERAVEGAVVKPRAAATNLRP